MKHRYLEPAPQRSWKHLIGLFVLLLATTGCDSQTHSTGTHAHGYGRLIIALENGQQGSIQLESPAESIYGFEYAPSTQEDIDAQASALQTLESDAASLWVFPAEADCTITVDEVRVMEDEHGDEQHEGSHDDHEDEDEDAEGHEEDGDHDEDAHEEEDEHHDEDGDAHDEDEQEEGGEHREVVASYLFNCAQDVTGQELSIQLGEAFPGFENLQVTLLSDSGQRGVDLDGAMGSVKLD